MIGKDVELKCVFVRLGSFLFSRGCLGRTWRTAVLRGRLGFRSRGAREFCTPGEAAGQISSVHYTYKIFGVGPFKY